MRRLVILTGTATLNVVIGEASSYASTIREALTAQGFAVVNVKVNKPQLFLSTINITIECNVDSQYSAEDARRSAIDVISNIGIQGSWFPNPLNIAAMVLAGSAFSNVSLSILSDGQPATATSDATLNDALSNITSFGAGVVKQAVDNTTKNVATPIAIAGVVGLGIILITLSARKR